jgi:hypothetical protein
MSVTPEEWLSQHTPLSKGTRVRLLGCPVGVTLRDADGTVVRPDTLDGYYIVRLDIPALYLGTDGHTEELSEIREAWDNLAVVRADHSPSPLGQRRTRSAT